MSAWENRSPLKENTLMLIRILTSVLASFTTFRFHPSGNPKTGQTGLLCLRLSWDILLREGTSEVVALSASLAEEFLRAADLARSPTSFCVEDTVFSSSESVSLDLLLRRCKSISAAISFDLIKKVIVKFISKRIVQRRKAEYQTKHQRQSVCSFVVGLAVSKQGLSNDHPQASLAPAHIGR